MNSTTDHLIAGTLAVLVCAFLFSVTYEREAADEGTAVVRTLNAAAPVAADTGSQIGYRWRVLAPGPIAVRPPALDLWAGYDEPKLERPLLLPPRPKPVAVEEPELDLWAGYDEPGLERPLLLPPRPKPVAVEEPELDLWAGYDEPGLEAPALRIPRPAAVTPRAPEIPDLSGLDDPRLERPDLIDPGLPRSKDRR